MNKNALVYEMSKYLFFGQIKALFFVQIFSIFELGRLRKKIVDSSQDCTQKEEIKRIDDDKAWEIAMRYEVSELPLLLPPEPIATMEQGEFFENFDNMRIEMKTLLARVEALESQIKNLKT